MNAMSDALHLGRQSAMTSRATQFINKLLSVVTRAVIAHHHTRPMVHCVFHAKPVQHFTWCRATILRQAGRPFLKVKARPR